jgi:hypothetical protein
MLPVVCIAGEQRAQSSETSLLRPRPMDAVSVVPADNGLTTATLCCSPWASFFLPEMDGFNADLSQKPTISLAGVRSVSIRHGR